MAKARYKQFVGTTINNWLLLEELGTSGNTPQARYSSRKYRVRHTITGEVGIRTMSSIRNSKRPILSKQPKEDLIHQRLTGNLFKIAISAKNGVSFWN